MKADIKMRSPWESNFIPTEEDHRGGGDDNHQRLPLGRLIECSTSDPLPISETAANATTGSFNFMGATNDPPSSLFRAQSNGGGSTAEIDGLYSDASAAAGAVVERSAGSTTSNSAPYGVQPSDISRLLPDGIPVAAQVGHPPGLIHQMKEMNIGGDSNNNLQQHPSSSTVGVLGMESVTPGSGGVGGAVGGGSSGGGAGGNGEGAVGQSFMDLIKEDFSQKPPESNINPQNHRGNEHFDTAAAYSTRISPTVYSGSSKPASPSTNATTMNGNDQFNPYAQQHKHHQQQNHQQQHHQRQQHHHQQHHQHQKQQRRRHEHSHKQQVVNTTWSGDKSQNRSRNLYDTSYQKPSQYGDGGGSHHQSNRSRSYPQYVAVSDHQYTGGAQWVQNSNVNNAGGRAQQGSIYAPITPNLQHHALTEHQSMYYGGHHHHRQPSPAGLEIQQGPAVPSAVIQSGQNLYVNHPPPHPTPYGYTTVQYHHHPAATAQILRPSMNGRGQQQHHIGEQQFISVVPIQSTAGHHAATTAQLGIGAGGQALFWHPATGEATSGPTAGTAMLPSVALLNTHHGAAAVGNQPIALTGIGNIDVPHRHRTNQNNFYGRGGRDKSGRGRRGGGRGDGSGGRGNGNSKRGGSDPKQYSNHHTAVSSPLLEEFRATKNRDWVICNITGHIVEFCQDQNGSRFIQQRLEVGDTTEQSIVMNEVLPAIHRLRNDVFGNYVVQKLLEFGTKQMKCDIRDTLQGEMLQLSLQMYGCRVVQKSLETLNEEDLPQMLREFHHNVLSCIHDQNGNHVIQKCIEVMSSKVKKALAIEERGVSGDAKGTDNNGKQTRSQFLSSEIDFVVDDVLNNVASLSCHPYGCRVLQRILEHCIEEKKVAALDEIRKCHKTLLDDQYGNYVIQHVLQFGRQSDRESILKIVVAGGLLKLSKQKFASNVVEKLLKYGTPQQRREIVKEMLKVVENDSVVSKPVCDTSKGNSSDDGNENAEGTNNKNNASSSVVILMVRDAYANYVVQTTLDVVPECEEKRLLLQELKCHSLELRNFTFAKHIVTKLSS